MVPCSRPIHTLWKEMPLWSFLFLPLLSPRPLPQLCPQVLLLSLLPLLLRLLLSLLPLLLRLLPLQMPLLRQVLSQHPRLLQVQNSGAKARRRWRRKRGGERKRDGGGRRREVRGGLMNYSYFNSLVGTDTAKPNEEEGTSDGTSLHLPYLVLVISAWQLVVCL
jgi:hypothetical protein